MTVRETPANAPLWCVGARPCLNRARTAFEAGFGQRMTCSPGPSPARTAPVAGVANEALMHTLVQPQGFCHVKTHHFHAAAMQVQVNV